MIDLTDTRKPPHLMSGNRCDDCLTPASRASLDLLRQKNPEIEWFRNTGVCSACGKTDDVYDIAHLLMMRYHGLIRGVPTAPGHGHHLANPHRWANPDIGYEPITLETHRKWVQGFDQTAARAIA
ncbi:hypothetical protein KUV57_12695 [Epibacterium sp. DP7N7-1]|nr:hypothetical protein [Epibacterium sp. DP7N7-1]